MLHIRAFLLHEHVPCMLQQLYAFHRLNGCLPGTVRADPDSFRRSSCSCLEHTTVNHVVMFWLYGAKIFHRMNTMRDFTRSSIFLKYDRNTASLVSFHSSSSRWESRTAVGWRPTVYSVSHTIRLSQTRARPVQWLRTSNSTNALTVAKGPVSESTKYKHCTWCHYGLGMEAETSPIVRGRICLPVHPRLGQLQLQIQPTSWMWQLGTWSVVNKWLNGITYYGSCWVGFVCSFVLFLYPKDFTNF